MDAEWTEYRNAVQHYGCSEDEEAAMNSISTRLRRRSPRNGGQTRVELRRSQRLSSISVDRTKIKNNEEGINENAGPVRCCEPCSKLFISWGRPRKVSVPCYHVLLSNSNNSGQKCGVEPSSSMNIDPASEYTSVPTIHDNQQAIGDFEKPKRGRPRKVTSPEAFVVPKRHKAPKYPTEELRAHYKRVANKECQARKREKDKVNKRVANEALIAAQTQKAENQKKLHELYREIDEQILAANGHQIFNDHSKTLCLDPQCNVCFLGKKYSTAHFSSQ